MHVFCSGAHFYDYFPIISRACKLQKIIGNKRISSWDPATLSGRFYSTVLNFRSAYRCGVRTAGSKQYLNAEGIEGGCPTQKISGPVIRVDKRAKPASACGSARDFAS